MSFDIAEGDESHDQGNLPAVSARSDDSAYTQLLATVDYSMFVVTTSCARGPAGCLMGFATEVSINPPRFLAGLSKRNFTFRAAQDATHLAVHVVPRRHLALARMFGELSGDRVDKFRKCRWHKGPQDMPILDDAAGWFVGRIDCRYDLGDHVGHLLVPVAGSEAVQSERYVSLGDVRDLEPGHLP
jgi:flavin reductase (DIM6/NTAB) family NADH-FMN oxidoreductase RutF